MSRLHVFHPLQFDIRSIDRKIVAAASPAGFFVHWEPRFRRGLCASRGAFVGCVRAAALPGAFITAPRAPLAAAGSSLCGPTTDRAPGQSQTQKCQTKEDDPPLRDDGGT